MSETTDDERFQLAAHSARRLVAQCRAHVVKTNSTLGSRLEHAPAHTPFAIDASASKAGTHPLSFQARVDQLVVASNALMSHLEGLEVLLRHETFHPIPALPIARAIAEVCATSAWLVGPANNPDERAARGYASMFHTTHVQRSTRPDLARTQRDHLIGFVRQAGGAIVYRKDDKGRVTEDVAQVGVGRAMVKTAFQYTRRVAQEIPAIDGQYATLSGVAHGDLVHVWSTWDAPEAYARLIGSVVHCSVEAWSRTIHTWVGVSPAPFLNQDDVRNMVLSLSPE